jgi:hypothetical protein
MKNSTNVTYQDESLFMQSSWESKAFSNSTKIILTTVKTASILNNQIYLVFSNLSRLRPSNNKYLIFKKKNWIKQRNALKNLKLVLERLYPKMDQKM